MPPSLSVFDSQLCQTRAVWPWASHLPFLGLISPSVKQGKWQWQQHRHVWGWSKCISDMLWACSTQRSKAHWLWGKTHPLKIPQPLLSQPQVLCSSMTHVHVPRQRVLLLSGNDHHQSLTALPSRPLPRIHSHGGSGGGGAEAPTKGQNSSQRHLWRRHLGCCKWKIVLLPREQEGGNLHQDFVSYFKKK